MALSDVISWTSGNFEFSDNLPQQALDGPIQISEADALQMALKSGKDTSNADNTDQILRDLARKIAGDKFVPPILPKTASKLESYWESGEDIAEKVLALAHKNQTLTANLLRVVNASVGCPKQKCTTLKQAMGLYSHEQLLGSILAQVTSAHPPKQPDTVSQLLQHALRCACLAEQIAAQLGENEEEAYTCGLLHNIGKTLLLQLLTNKNVADNQLPQLVKKFHQNSGALLSLRWNLSPQLHDCIKYYHMPQQAKESPLFVEIVYLSHNLLITRGDEESYKEQCPHIDFELLDIDSLINGLDLIDKLVDATF